MSKYIENLYDVCETEKTKDVYVRLSDKQKRKRLSTQFYVEDEVSFYFVATGEYKCDAANSNNILSGIEYEATDICWQPKRIKDINYYMGCEVCVVDGDDFDDDNVYEISDIVEDDKSITLVCEEI